jgi:hypothetical protein
MNRVRVARTVAYNIECCDCGKTIAGPYPSYDLARQLLPTFQTCNHPDREDTHAPGCACTRCSDRDTTRDVVVHQFERDDVDRSEA